MNAQKTTIFARTAVWISQGVIVVFVREDLTWLQTKNTAEVSML